MAVPPIFRRLLQKPFYLRWLDQAPQSVQEAHTAAQRSYYLVQLPLCLVAAGLFALTLNWNSLFNLPLVRPGLLAIAILALLWPIPAWRLGVAAWRSTQQTQAGLCTRLRVMAILCFVLAALSCACLLILGTVWVLSYLYV